jgi:hypothetical protein
MRSFYEDFLFREHNKVKQGQIRDDPTVVFVSQPIINLVKVPCRKLHCHEAKLTCPAKDFIFFDETINVQKLEERTPDCFGGTNL